MLGLDPPHYTLLFTRDSRVKLLYGPEYRQVFGWLLKGALFLVTPYTNGSRYESFRLTNSVLLMVVKRQSEYIVEPVTFTGLRGRLRGRILDAETNHWHTT